MYSSNTGSSSSNMLYGGPLGAYLSGIYQPSSSSTPRRGSLYGGGGGSTSTSSGPPPTSSVANSIFYTPQPTRRKFGGSSDSVGSNDSGRGISPRHSGYSSRWSSGTNFSSSDSAPDYKKMYEAQLAENETTRADLERVKRQLEDSKQDVIALRDKKVSPKLSKLEKKMQECEQEVKNLAALKAENAKIKEENVALIRVISKLSK